MLPRSPKGGNIDGMSHWSSGRCGIAAILCAWAAWSVTGWAAPQSALPPEAKRAAEDFLYAFSRNDRDAISRLVPKSAANLFGPCPFSRMPSLSKPRADGRVGAVEFEGKGKMSDPGLPGKGIVILRLVEEGGSKNWRIRQIYWYEELPPEADIPERSPTEEDKRQEPALREAAKEFLHYWLASDYQEMERRIFRWWEVDRRPPKWVRMTGVDLKARPTTLNGIRVDFDAKLKLIRVVPRSVSGMIWLVQEDGAWRVRPLTFAFFF